MSGNFRTMVVCFLSGGASFGLVAGTAVFLHTHNFNQDAVGGFETPSAQVIKQTVTEEAIGGDDLGSSFAPLTSKVEETLSSDAQGISDAAKLSTPSVSAEADAVAKATDAVAAEEAEKGSSSEEELSEIAEEISAEDASEDVSLSYISYRVQKGDIIGRIASRYCVTEDTIISVNNIKSSRNIQIGQYLKIPSMPGILYTVKSGDSIEKIAGKYNIDAQKCLMVNNIADANKIQVGSTIFLPDAKMDYVTKQEINGDLFLKPLKGKYYISSYYGYRASPFTGVRSFHTGIDMATSQGTKIYASSTGKVVFAGYNSVFGKHVIVQHHSGYKTLYGHMSAISVVNGQTVTSDTVLGRVGSTGMSTGPHLHFTVYKNGKTVNPAALWR